MWDAGGRPEDNAQVNIMCDDSQRLASRERTLKELKQHEKLPTPVLAHVSSPSPAKGRRPAAVSYVRPSLQALGVNVAPVKLPSELFAIATNRNSQGDVALSKALDGIQAAATRLETERAKLVIQSQELQIWDMSREEELVLLRAENEQLEQKLTAVADKVGKGLGRDGVLDSLQFALRKARTERDAEMREADSLFNQLQEAKATAMELNELRAAFSAALSSLSDEWSAIPLLAEEARDLRARADAAAQDPTRLGHKDMTTLLRGLLVLVSRGSELQHEAQALRGEKAALQQALDAAHQQLEDEHGLPRQEPGSAPPEDPGRRPRGAGHGPGQSSGSEPSGQHPQQLAALQQQVSELQAKLAEYRAYLEDNQEEIEGLQVELKQLHQAQGEAGQAAGAQNVLIRLHAAPRGPHRYAPTSSARGPPSSSTTSAAAAVAVAGSTTSGVAASTHHPSDAATARRRQKEQAPPKPLYAAQLPYQVLGTPTRHIPSSSSPISTVNYGGSPPITVGSPTRGSPITQQAAADIAFKVAELQELALRAQQQAADREANATRQHEAQLEALRQQLAQQRDAELAELRAQLTVRQQEAQLQALRQHEAHQKDAELAELRAHLRARQPEADFEALRQQLTQQKDAQLAELRTQLTARHAAALAEAEAREADLARQHSRAVSELEAQAAKLATQHAQALADLHAQVLKQTTQRAQALAEREAQAAAQHAQHLQEHEAELARQHAEVLVRLAAQAEARVAGALAEQADELARQHAQQLREAEDRLAAQHARRLQELEQQLARHFSEQAARREADVRHKHAERLAEQAAELARLHAEQAAQLGIQHAEATADREAQLLDHFERQLAEREGLLASMHADQLREIEAQFAVQADDAADLREAQMQRQFAERLAQALRQQQESLAAHTEVRLTAERAEMRAELARMARAQELAQAARQLEEDGRRREGELAAQLEEQRRRVEVLERQVLKVQITVAEPSSARGPQAVGSGGATGEGADGVASAEGAWSDVSAATAEGEASERHSEEKTYGHLRQLAEQSEQLQRYADELEAVFDEAERRREEAVADVERKYVEVVARLGRDHEKAVAEARAAHELREANLRAALERQAQEARDAERRHVEQVKMLQGQLASLRKLLMEREGPITSRADLDEQLEADLDAIRQRDAEMLGELASLTVGARTVAAGGPEPASAAADAWSDGKALLWPGGGDSASASNSRSSTSSGGDVAVPVATPATACPASEAVAEAQLQPQQQGREEAIRRSDPDLALNLLRMLRVNDDGPNARLWGSSIEFDLRAAPRQELLRGHGADATATQPTSVAAQQRDAPEAAGSREGSVAGGAREVPRGGSAQGTAAPQGLGESAGASRGAASQARDQVLAGVSPAHAKEPEAGARVAAQAVPVSCPAGGDVGAGAGTGSRAQRGADGAEEWGELVGAPLSQAAMAQRSAGTAVFGAVAGAGIAASAGGGTSAAGGGPGYLSEAATSVSTDTEYNSETEFYVDDEDDDDGGGRALAVALAQSPSAAQAELPRQVPALLEELQRRRRTQSAAAAVMAASPPPKAPARSTEATAASTAGVDSSAEAELGGAGRVSPPQPEAGLAEGSVGSRAAGEVVGAPGSDKLETTLSVAYPALDTQLLASAPPAGDVSMTAAPAVVTAAQAVDLEATLSGPFPVLPPLLQPMALRRPPLPPLVVLGKAHTLAPSDSHGDRTSRSGFPVAQAQFSFSEPQRSSPGWDGTPIGGGNPLGVLEPPAARDDPCSRPGETPQQDNNLTASFDFSSGDKAWLPSAGSDAAGGQQADAARSRPGSSGDDRGSSGGHAGGSPSGAVPRLPPLLPRPRPALEQQVWVDLTEDDDSSADDHSEAIGGDDPGPAAGEAAVGASEPRAVGANRPAPWSPRAARATEGVTPLMLPNPLYEEGGEVSPPWSAADWNAGGGSPLGRETSDDGGSLPQTPGSESGEGHGESAADGSDEYQGSGPSRIADEDISHGAWNVLYNLPYEPSPPEWNGSLGGRDSDQAPTDEGTESRSSSSSGDHSRSGGGTPHLAGVGFEVEVRCASSGRSPVGRRLVLDDFEDDEGEEVVDAKNDKKAEDDPDDDLCSLLAAGATVSSTELRRRHRRRMGAAPVGSPEGHPIDLLRQGWEISGGIASPISPQSAPRQGSPLDLAADPRISPLRQLRAAPPLSPEELQHHHEAQLLQQLLPLHALGRGRGSPSGTRRSGITSPSPRASPLKPRAASPGAPGRRAADSPRTPARGPGPADKDMPTPAAGALVAASSGASSFMGSPLGIGRPMSPLEARQRSRALLGRARSRVAELEGQCRALAATLQSASSNDGADTADAGDFAAAVAARSPRATADRVVGRSLDADHLRGAGRRGEGAPRARPPREPAAATGSHGSTYKDGALVMAPPQAQAAPAEVVYALEDLRGDLNELEALHRLTVLAAGRGPTGSGGALFSEPRPAVLLLAGLAGGAVAAAAAAAVASAVRSGASSPRLTGSPEADGGRRGPQVAQSAGSPCTSPRTAPAAAWAEPFGAESDALSCTEARPVGALGAEPAVVPGSPTLDPALVALLQLSIQAQVQGQLGQLEAKIAELQRQNQALLAAATAASTPATPLPPPSSFFRHGGAASAARTPLLPATPLTMAGAATGGRTAAGGAEAGDGRWTGAVGPSPSGDAAAAQWSKGVGGLWGQAGSGGGANAWASREVFPAVWETTPPPAAAASSGASQGHSSMSIFATTPAAGAGAAVPIAVTPALTPAQQASFRTLADMLAGPYSPEELSQLPPGVQLYAPPQLRAAALAAVREHSQAHRRSL